MQAKSSQKTAIGTQKYHNNRIKKRGPKRERETSYLTLDILSKIFMETPSPSVSPSSSQRTPSNSGFKNPLLAPVLSDDFEANKMTADNAISTVCAPHKGDSRIKILIFPDQYILEKKSDSDTLKSVKSVSNVSLLLSTSLSINNPKNQRRAPRSGELNGENAKSF
jgi:hypothetical protein